LEFQAWLSEVKGWSYNRETTNIDRKYYEEFIDNYNYCKFPNKKYYDIYKWEVEQRKKSYIRSQKHNLKISKENANNIVAPDDMEFIFDDEGKKEKEKKLLRELEQKKKLEEAIFTMNKEKAEAMKEVDYKNSLMRHYYQTGDMVAAKDLHKQLVGTKNGTEEIPKEEFPGEEEND